MKRPLVPVTLCYIVGLVLAEAFQPQLWLLFALSFGVLVLAFMSASRRAFLLWPLVLLVAWTNLVSRTAIIAPDDLRVVIGAEGELATIRGTLAQPPSERLYEKDGKVSWRTLAEVKVTAIRRNRSDAWEPVTGSVMTTTSGQLPRQFFVGQPVEIYGSLLKPGAPVAEGLFDYRTFLARQGIYFQFKVQNTVDWQLLPFAKTTLPLSERFLDWAQRTLSRGLPPQVKDQPLHLIWAMTLGWRPGLTNEVSEPFMQSGTMHIFAISGLHIALIAGILVSLLRVVRVSRLWCGLVVIPLIWFYTGATGWQSSAIRSTVMMTIIIGGWALERPTDLLNSLATAAFVILIWQPQQLFQASFQLSFLVVLSIALFLPPMEKLRDRLLAHDPLLPSSLVPTWKRWLGTPLRWLMTAFATSFAAWLGSLPLTAYYFHLFSPVTLLANLVIVPLSSAALACNLGSLICGDWFPIATELFNNAGWGFMWLMTVLTRLSTELPYAFFYVRAPGFWDFVIYYAVLITALNGWLFAKQWRKLSVIGVVVIATFYGWRWHILRNETDLTILPLEGAHCVFIDRPGQGRDWLEDCGRDRTVDFIVKPFLRAQGVNHLPRLLLTHGDINHVGGLEEIEKLFGVDEVDTTSIRFRSPSYRKIAERLDSEPDRHRIIHRGSTNDNWRVLHPEPKDKFPQADDSAIVLLGEFDGTRILLCSDLGRPGQEVLMQRESDLRADIVVAGLAEDSEPLSNALLERIKPKVIIIADSDDPATKQAKEVLRRRIEQYDAHILYTRFANAVTITCDKSGWRLRTMSGLRLDRKSPIDKSILPPLPMTEVSVRE